MTIGDGSTILAADLHTAEDYELANALALRKAPHYLRVPCQRQGVDASTALVERSVIFTPQAPYELVALFGRCMGLASSQTLTIALEVVGGDAVFLLDETISDLVTSTGSDTSTAEDFSVSTSPRIVLRPGVPYRLSVATSGASTLVQAIAAFKLRKNPR